MSVDPELVERKIALILADLDQVRRLASLGVVAAEQAAGFARLAGLRKRLAHEHDGLDQELV